MRRFGLLTLESLPGLFHIFRFENYMYSNDDEGSGRLASIVSTRFALYHTYNRTRQSIK